jgi:hypothetical protein
MKRMLLGLALMTCLLTAGIGCCCGGGLCGGLSGCGGDDESGQYDQGAQMGHVAYPYYTVRGPRDFLADF